MAIGTGRCGDCKYFRYLDHSTGVLITPQKKLNQIVFTLTVLLTTKQHKGTLWVSYFRFVPQLSPPQFFLQTPIKKTPIKGVYNYSFAAVSCSLSSL